MKQESAWRSSCSRHRAAAMLLLIVHLQPLENADIAKPGFRSGAASMILSVVSVVGSSARHGFQGVGGDFNDLKKKKGQTK